MPIFQNTPHHVSGRIPIFTGSDERPIAVDGGDVAFGVGAQGEARWGEHFFGRNFAAGDRAGAFGALGEVSAAFDPEQLVGGSGGARVAVNALHALQELFDDLFGARVDGLALAGRQHEADERDAKQGEWAASSAHERRC